MKNKLFLLLVIIALAFTLRFFRLGDVPLGFHQDEVSQSYNSFSILKTGKDRYGQSFPVLFRSFGSYQPPVYTYLTPPAILLFGNTIFAARFMSAFFGTLIVFLSFLISRQIIKGKENVNLSLLFSLIVAISPWAIHFSRRVVEGTLGLFFFLLALFLFLKSLKKIKFFWLACFSLGVATHAYYSERLIAVIFLPLFLFYFRQYFLKYKNEVFLGLLVLGLTLIPHIITILGGAFASRFDQVGSSGGSFIIEFFKHFSGYLSPKNLFSDIGSGLARVSPNLGVFYEWFIFPFFVGLYVVSKYIENKFLKFFGLFTLISLIPVSLTGDVFYPLRALEYFWILSFIIAAGLFNLSTSIKNPRIKWTGFFVLVFYSLASFYISYFILFQHETTEQVGNTYKQLSDVLYKYKENKIFLDSSRDPAAGLRLAYFRAYDPVKLQQSLKNQLITPYYSRKVELNNVYVVDNIVAKPFEWKDACGINTIIIGDNLTISAEQINNHKLKPEFVINSVEGNPALFGYSVNAKCE